MAENDNKEEQEELKIGFFRKIGYSITKFEKYPEMAAEGMPRAFIYLAQIMLIFSIIVSLAFIYKTHTIVKNGVNYIQNEIPDITYIDGNLKVYSEEPIIIDTQTSIIDKIIIDTNTENNEKIEEYLKSIPIDNSGILILKDRAIIKVNGMEESETYTYDQILSSISNLNFNNSTKQDIINYLSGNIMFSVYLAFFVLMLVYVFAIYIISVIIDTLLVAILGRITLLFTKLKLKFSAVYNMSIYALTISILLNAIYIAINTITGFEMKYFHVMYTSIAYVCLVAAIFIIKSDLMKRQEEVMKIMEEQKNVKQEMEEQKEEEDKKENKNPKDEKDKDDEDPKDDGEPSGSEA